MINARPRINHHVAIVCNNILELRIVVWYNWLNDDWRNVKILKWLGLAMFVFGVFLFPSSISSLDSSPTYKFNNQSNPMIMDPIFDFDDFSGATYEIGGSGSWSEPVTGGGMTFVAK